VASKLKKLWWLMLVFAVCNIAIALILFFGNKQKSPEESTKPIPQKNVYSIGVLQSESLPEQDKMVAGALAGLESSGYANGERLHIEVINANGDDKKLERGAKKFSSNKKDLIIAVGTDSAKALAKVTKNIPVVGVGVYLFKSDEVFKSHENFTGISDTPQVLTQIRTAAQCFPVNKLGILYDPTDEDSVLQLKILRAVSEQKNISLFEVAFNPDQRSDIQIRKFLGNVNAVYIPEDPAVLKNFDAVVKILTPAGIPIIGEQMEMVKKGALISVSPSYYRMGFSGGRIAARLLSGNFLPENIPITHQIDPDMVINMKQADLLHIKLPSDVWQRARKLYLYDNQPARP
jgi:putative ABC transport system substrate-binding protein